MLAVKIPADPALPVEVVDDELTLDYLQAAVGGFIEAVNVYDVLTLNPVEANGVEFTVFVNEEGKLIGLPANDLATGLCATAIMPDDFIAGDVIVVGPPDDEGEGTDCPMVLIDLLRLGDVIGQEGRRVVGPAGVTA